MNKYEKQEYEARIKALESDLKAQEEWLKQMPYDYEIAKQSIPDYMLLLCIRFNCYMCATSEMTPEKFKFMLDAMEKVELLKRSNDHTSDSCKCSNSGDDDVGSNHP